jgi:hypothetical protein
MPPFCEHGLDDKEERERVGDGTCPERGVGGWGNSNERSVKVNRNESCKCSGLKDSIGGLGAGRGLNKVSCIGETSLSARK